MTIREITTSIIDYDFGPAVESLSTAGIIFFVLVSFAAIGIISDIERQKGGSRRKAQKAKKTPTELVEAWKKGIVR